MIAMPERLLLGSGPSPVPPQILAAIAQPTVGHLDPAFGELMEHTVGLLREVFLTANPATLPISATGSGGMDALVANFVSPGDRVVCGVNGLFGERMADALGRADAEVVRVEAPWGRAIDPSDLVAATRPGLDAMVVVHGETSTGVCQPLEGLSAACRERDALLLVDCVTSLAGQRLAIDEDGVDAAFSGTQKCLNCPPGLAPLTAGPRALERLRARRTPVRSWYLDLSLVLAYWVTEASPADATPAGGSPPRTYHHTAPINLIYALHEALELVCAEGLPARWERHRRAHEALRAALATMGLERLAPAEHALAPLLAVKVPDELPEAELRGRLLREHGIEISGGLGPLAGRIWRIGVMGVGAQLEPQLRLVRALGSLLGADAGEA
ncbi:MAG TPA: alanine--glyoxylate aminotransferase family protein, partial [Solirubrobacteraceae bacterium]|nr:alanine--glyoxylate aminotransferase family protein [Solirubrobacteraceae bacterium]